MNTEISTLDYPMKALAISASGGYEGPEGVNNKPGYYAHYHLKNRIGGHSFYGSPFKGIY